ncbi:MAG: hypothetical protein SGJ20_11250 [Planctomycetota bacterium]|nr:hypothetical protein [Planctomycetota bacterium]
MRFTHRLCLSVMVVALSGLATTASAQMQMTGRLNHAKFAGSNETVPMSAVAVFALKDAVNAEPIPFRTWETEPPGWFRLTGNYGRYSLLFGTPSHYMRPLIRNNVFVETDKEIVRSYSPEFDFAMFDPSGYDSKAAVAYYQTFVAKGNSLTNVGFRLVHDGVDGQGPGKQDFLISVHKKGPGTPDTWEQVGPTGLVLEVNNGGAIDYAYSVGWNSEEVPLQAGETYAVQLRTKKKDGTFQAHWKANDDTTEDCFRVAANGDKGWQKHDLWIAIDSDSDGLVIPYNKRVTKTFVNSKDQTLLTQSRKKWTQTYVAQGTSLAAVQLYAAFAGTQPSMMRQRLRVTVREGGPEGKIVGKQNLTIGNGLYTGDASWGTAGTMYNPGDVPLVPGQTYAIEFESIEGHETLNGFINFKGQFNDEKASFNPYRKQLEDSYDQGTAYVDGKDAGFDLDMQIVEFVKTPKHDWSKAVEKENLLKNGDMEKGTAGKAKANNSELEGWTRFATIPETVARWTTDRENQDNHIAQVRLAGYTNQPIDGGFVQKVEGLSHLENYRASGKVRCTWPIMDRYQCYVGVDPTGQTDDPKASTIKWTMMPDVHGVWVPYLSDPIRPAWDKEKKVQPAISVWLRGKAKSTEQLEYRADFDDFSLSKVRTAPPGSMETK